MPELPDVVAYIEALQPRLVGRVCQRVSIVSPFVLRTFDPPIEMIEGRAVAQIGRLGKRIVLDFGDELFLIIHPMIAGRFRWLTAGAKSPAKITLARLDFETGVLALTEASQKKRASIHLVQGGAALAAHNPAGLELLDPVTTHVFDVQPSPSAAPQSKIQVPTASQAAKSKIAVADAATFSTALRRQNNTLKRALTDPHRFSGVGNAYSDEILHAARLSPVTLTNKLTDQEIERLFDATLATLQKWIEILREQFADHFPAPGEITAFRPDFAVHGKFGQPCPACGTKVQRIRYADNETNYCPTCQTGGKLLADRSLSRLLKDDWPRTIEELES